MPVLDVLNENDELGNAQASVFLNDPLLLKRLKPAIVRTKKSKRVTSA